MLARAGSVSVRPFSASAQSTRRGAVQAEARDRIRDPGGTRPSIGSPRATRARTASRKPEPARDREERDAVGCWESSARLAHSVSGTPGRIATPRRTSSRTRSGPFHAGSPRARLRRGGRSRPRACAPRASRPCARDGRARHRRPGRPRTRAARARGGSRPGRTSPCARDRRRRGRAASRGRARARRARERDVADVRGIERAAEDSSCHSSTSPSTSTSTPRLTPAPAAPPRARPAAAACPRRGSRGPCAGCGSSGRAAASAGIRGTPAAARRPRAGCRRAELEERVLQLVDPSARHARRRRRLRRSARPRARTRAALEQVDLVQDDDLRPFVEARAVGGELAIDRVKALHGVLFGRVDHVQEQPRALEMREELVTEAGAVRGALDEPRDVGDRELARVRAFDGSEHRLDRRERVVGDLRLRVRDAAEERRLARVREPGERGVDDELEAQREVGLVTWKPGLREAWRLPGRRREARVAAPARRPARRRTRVPGDVRSATSRPSASSTCVPTGTRISTFSPSAPCFRLRGRCRPCRRAAPSSAGAPRDREARGRRSRRRRRRALRHRRRARPSARTSRAGS